MTLHKIPLEAFIQILQDLYENGADFIDISGEMGEDKESFKDTIKITVKPEYLSGDSIEEVELDYSNDIIIKKISDDDIKDLI